MSAPLSSDQPILRSANQFCDSRVRAVGPGRTIRLTLPPLRTLRGDAGEILTVTRLARGVPVGSELEYVDLSTLAHALTDRR